MSPILLVLMTLLMLSARPSGKSNRDRESARGLGAAMTILVILLLLGGLVDTPIPSCTRAASIASVDEAWHRSHVPAKSQVAAQPVEQ
jgi:heme A synthase